jgi:UDP-N-acetylglucosamine--N-acetylmuramyl-(pentapeptide) pyrophosphoryl-undecaprenol N-acetylglucosamine transferase
VRVLLAGGGTAGHIEPALATADALCRIDPATEVTMLGTPRGLETRLVPARGYPLELVPPVPLPRRVGRDLLVVPARLRTAVADTLRVLDRLRPDVVVGFGGYVCVPAYLAARRRRIPIVVHEANARAGVANRLGARFTRHVAVASPAAGLAHAVHLGMPLRSSIATLDRGAARGGARERFGLAGDAPVILVFGGSQGAQRLNRAVVSASGALRAAGIQVLQVTGVANHDEVLAALADRGVGSGWVAVPYVDDMPAAYAASDLAVCRAGAMTVAELTAVGLAAVYVPLPIGNGEQRLNAEPVVAAGGGLLIPDGELDGATLAACVVSLVSDTDRLGQMSKAAATLGRRDADEALARMILAAAG